MKASEYKEFKGIRKESLRDNMTDIEIATREITKVQKPKGLKDNKKIAKKGGNIAKNARNSIEKEINKSIISRENSLNYQYIEKEKQINS